jgi:hypothetical protein
VVVVVVVVVSPIISAIWEALVGRFQSEASLKGKKKLQDPIMKEKRAGVWLK